MGNQPYRNPNVYIPPPHNDTLNNTPFAAKYGSTELTNNPFGYIEGKSPAYRNLGQKAPLKRNQIFDQRKEYGAHGY